MAAVSVSGGCGSASAARGSCSFSCSAGSVGCGSSAAAHSGGSGSAASAQHQRRLRQRGGSTAVAAAAALAQAVAAQRLVACYKSNDGTTKARRYRFRKQSEKKKLTLYLELKKKPIVQVDDERNCYPTSFKLLSLALLSKNHKKVLPGTSLFHPEASVNQPNQVKPTLLSLLFWNGLSGVSCFHCWRAIPLARIWRGMLANHLGSSNHFVF